MSRLFTDVIRDMRGGKIVNTATDELAELVCAVLETNKAGSLTLKLTIKPDKGGENQLTLEASIDTKLPKLELPASIFFGAEDGSLTRTDPRQAEMSLSEVSSRKSPGVTGDQLRTVQGTTEARTTA